MGIGAKPYKYDIYKDNITWYVMFDGLDICFPIYHRRDAGEKTLTYERSVQYHSQTTYEFASNWGVTASAEVVNATVGEGVSIARTFGMSRSATGGVAAKVPSYAPTGYYKMTICHNFESYQFYKYDRTGNFVGNDYSAGLPIGLPYLAVLHSTSSGSGYSIYG